MDDRNIVAGLFSYTWETTTKNLAKDRDRGKSNVEICGKKMQKGPHKNVYCDRRSSMSVTQLYVKHIHII